MTDFISSYASNFGNKVAVIDDNDNQLSWSQFNTFRNKLVFSLNKLKINAESKALIYSHNSMFYILLNQTLSSIGAIPVAINWRFKEKEVTYIINNSDSEIVFFQNEFVNIIQSITQNCPKVRNWVVIDAPAYNWSLNLQNLIEQGQDCIPNLPINLSGGMVYTGGTTGYPKGVIRKAVDAEFQKLIFRGFQITPSNDIIHLVAGPLYHSAPGFLSTLCFKLGATLVVMRKFSAEGALALIQKYKCTHTFMAPILLKLIVALPENIIRQYDISSMRHISVAAAPCPMQVKEAILRIFGPSLYEFYGASEIGVNTILLPQDILRKPGSCGKAAPGNEIFILDRETKQPLPPNREGLLYIRRNPGVMDQYYNDKEKTNSICHNDLITVGDIAKIDEEGFVYICDRAIDMVISGGVNIYPTEIEDLLHRHEAIQDVAVFGVPDDLWGEKLHAAIVLKPQQNVTAKELEEFCRLNIADYKIPREYSFHKEEDFPRDKAGKILKRNLRAPFWTKMKSKL
eukprot:TRINITY_DN2585_c0_g1_i1.p1 TRINITY_DN2585_c0_g1~~TRINITY_DN2585_c0_g1_i1.p1  ORF type:complete len:514 (+),score=212.52 TRINITY_DN2585_c0_g1_i1:50-1591(+)